MKLKNFRILNENIKAKKNNIFSSIQKNQIYNKNFVIIIVN